MSRFLFIENPSFVCAYLFLVYGLCMIFSFQNSSQKCIKVTSSVEADPHRAPTRVGSDLGIIHEPVTNGGANRLFQGYSRDKPP
jgi:hypothetical protein